MAEQIGTGSAAGLYDFCDWLIKKGLMTSSAVEPLRSATKQIVSTVDDEKTPDQVILGEDGFDVEDYMDRFERRAGNKYAPDSLNAYRRRFRRAIELYRQYLSDGPANFKAPPRRIVRKKVERENGANGGRTGTAAQHTPQQDPPGGQNAPAVPPAGLTDYPFPLRSGQMAHLHLPSPLDKDDADRLTQFLRALVFDRPAQLPSGDPDGE